MAPDLGWIGAGFFRTGVWEDMPLEVHGTYDL